MLDGMSDKYDKALGIIWAEIKNMAQTIPFPLSLDKLINTQDSFFSLRSGQQVFIDPKELIDLSSFLPDYLWPEFILPIIFLKKDQIYELVDSKKIVLWLIEKIIFPEKKIVSPYLIKGAYAPRQTYFYSYQVQKIRRRFPSLVYILYYGSTKSQEVKLD